MTTDYDKFIVRERRIWEPFQYAMRFTADQVIERAIIFGLYSGAYNNGLSYLQSLEDFELALLLDDYNQKMAGLDADEQNMILEISARRYIARIEDLIAAEKQSIKREGIEADDEAWDAKFAALEADRAALLTLEAQYAGRIREIAARIATLQAQILIEGADFQLVELELSGKYLELARAENELIGKDIDLELKDVEIAEREIAIINKDIELARKALELLEQANSVRKFELAESQAENRSLEVANDLLRIQLDTVNESLKYLEAEKEAAQLKIQTTEYTEQIAKTALLNVELAEATAEKSMADVEFSKTKLIPEELGLDLRKLAMDKKQVDMDWLDADKELAGIAVDHNQTVAKSYELATLEYDLEKEQVNLAVDTSNLTIYDAKISMIDSQTATITAEVANEAAVATNITTIHTADMTLMSSLQTETLDDIANHEEDVSVKLTQAEEMEQSNLDLLDLKIPKETAFTTLQVEGLEADTTATRNRYEAEVAIKQRVMEAELLTTLKHSIGVE